MPSHNKTIAKNTIILYVRMLIVTLISLYTSRLILQTLGVEDFGIYNIAGGLISFFTVINTAMSSSVQRFLNIELGRENHHSFAKTFNTGIEIHLLMAGAVFVLGETIGLYAYFHWLNIPTDRITVGHIVYQFSLLAALVTIIKTPYNALIIAKERMSIFAYLSIFETVAKLLAVIALTMQPFDNLLVYAASIFGIGLIVFIAMAVYSHKNLAAPSFGIVSLKSETSKQMVSFSVWSLLGNFSNVFTWQGINMLLNVFFGVTLNAAVGVTNQVTNTISSFTSSFQVAYKPAIIQYYVKDRTEFVKLVCRASKYSFFLLFAIIFPLYFHVDFILQLWLDNVPEYSSSFVRVLLLSLVLNSINVPFYNTLEAHGKISGYQIISTLTTPLILVYSYAMLRCGFSPVWIMCSHFLISICLLCVSLLFICKMELITFKVILGKVFLPILKVITLTLLFSTIVRVETNLIDIIIKLMLSIILIAAVGMSRMEVKRVVEIILKRD